MAPRRQAAPLAPPPPPQQPAWLTPHIQKLPEPLALLRTNWKWAAFGQFFFTFNHLFNMEDVTLDAIEDDLHHNTSLVLPRVMQRLLWTLTYDRKSTSNAWQNVLRRQYAKRDPAANPIGPDPSLATRNGSASRHNTAEPSASHDNSSPAPHITHSTDDVKMDESSAHVDMSASDPANIPTEATTEDVKPDAEERVDEHADAVTAPADSVKASEEVPEDVQSTEESKDWLQLPMLEKLDCLHLLTEWQFQNPSRLRQLMKSDDETATWRIEPIGYDVKKNAYWFIGADRLWIQRAIPRPPRSKTLKRKRAAAPPTKTARNNKRSPAKRPRVESDPPAASKSRASSSRKPTGRTKRETPKAATPPAGGRGGSRAAKAQANIKLDAQAKELAELQRQAQLNGARSTGTRISSRLRGRDEDEEWQQVPDEWLTVDDVETGGRRAATNGRSTRSSVRHAVGADKTRTTVATENARAAAKRRRAPESDEEDEESDAEDEKAMDSDGVSELTELSDDEGEEEQDESHLDGAQDEEQAVPQENNEPAEQPLPEGFVEWETIAVTLDEWEHVADPFENATHYLEKALYKALTKGIVPFVVEDLRAVERKRQIEEAVVHRKRSSRIAVKESEKEEARLEARRRAEEREKNSRAKRHEARQTKEEERGRDARESAREQRKREREEREERAQREQDEKELAERAKAEEAQRKPAAGDTPAKANGSARSRSSRKRKITTGIPASEITLLPAPSAGTRTPEWELDCEVCLRRGINIDDGIPMMCCGSCSRWQHITCHDRLDVAAGRPKRDWNAVDFVCNKCRVRQQEYAYAAQQQQQQQQAYYGAAAARPAYAPHQYAIGQPGAYAYGNGWTPAAGAGTPPYAGAYHNGHAAGYTGQPAYGHYQHQAPYAPVVNGALANGTNPAGGSGIANGTYLGQAQPDSAKWAMHTPPAPPPVQNPYTQTYAESSRYLHTQPGYGV
ncbi:hypothetical protein BD626DRAFT_400216 [Schizophyllum amplum]|uniref:Zinc finger PHD-type domain-containing protein n=1 Tax=Schizophyllum amplum TaxID=97359 RepID=A0A550CJH5_9AGAR|nr:hypothetical protein BD626DRAFT_400216 [Auriculariopsis ampla]